MNDISYKINALQIIIINKNILKCYCRFATACCRVILVTHFLTKVLSYTNEATS